MYNQAALSWSSFEHCLMLPGLQGLQTKPLQGTSHPLTTSPPQKLNTRMVVVPAKHSFLVPSPATTPPPTGFSPSSGSSPPIHSHMGSVKAMTGRVTAMVHHHRCQACEHTLQFSHQGRATSGMPQAKNQLSSLQLLACLFCQTAVKTKMTYLCRAARACEP